MKHRYFGGPVTLAEKASVITMRFSRLGHLNYSEIVALAREVEVSVDVIRALNSASDLTTKTVHRLLVVNEESDEGSLPISSIPCSKNVKGFGSRIA